MVRFCDSIFCRAALSRSSSSFQQVLERGADLQPDGLRVLDENQLLEFSQRFENALGEPAHLVAANSHSTALYLRTNSPFTFLNIS